MKILFYSFILFSCGSALATESLSKFHPVRIPLERYGDMPGITLGIGKERTPLHLLLDSGAGIQTSIRIMEDSGVEDLFHETGHQKSTIDYYGKGKVSSIEIPEIHIADLRYSNYKATVGRIPEPQPGVHGLIGLKAFIDHTLLIDYHQMELWLLPDQLNYSTELDESWIRCKFEYVEDCIALKIKVEGFPHPLSCILDTGVVAKHPDFGNFNVLKDDLLSKVTDDAVVNLSGNHAILGKAMQLSDRWIAPENFLFLDSFKLLKSVDGFIGDAFLERNRVLIDFKNRLVFIQPIQQP